MQDNTIGDSHLEDMVEFADNPEPRCPCVLLLDVSGSMRGSRIEALNNALQTFRQEITSDSLTALRAEIAVVEFDHEIRVIQDFTTADEFQPPTLAADRGGTRIAAAIKSGLRMAEERKQAYRANAIAYFRPIVMVLTDGYPEHDTPEDIQDAAQQVKEAEEGSHAAVFSFVVEPIVINGHDPIAELSAMMAPRRPALPLYEAQLNGIFQWLANSVEAMTHSQPGDRVSLPALEGYLEV